MTTTNDGSVVTLVFGRKPSCELEDFVSMYGRGLSRDDGGYCQERRKACVRTRLSPGETSLSFSTASAVAVSNI
jgi:hypothetical protein